MKIGIDISQIVYEGTGVSAYVRTLVTALIKQDSEHEYVLFGASLRRRNEFTSFVSSINKTAKHVRLVTIPLPPTLLDVIWNRWHIIPIEWFVGPIDIFWSSDWTQPPLMRAKGVTTIHDLSILRYPEESHNKTEVDAARVSLAANIVATQKRRLMRAAKVCQAFFCDSEATKRDAKELLGIAEDKLKVVYPGYQ